MNPKHFWFFGTIALALNAAGWWWIRENPSGKSQSSSGFHQFHTERKVIVNSGQPKVAPTPTPAPAGANAPRPSPPLIWQGARCYPEMERELVAYLDFNQQLDPSASLPALKFSPEVPGVSVSREDNQLVLRGPFQPRRSYEVTLAGDLAATSGQALPTGQVFTVNFPGRPSAVKFPFDQGVLNPRGNLGIVLTTTNLSKLELGGYRLYPNNLASFLRERGAHMDSMEPLVTREVGLKAPADELKETELSLRDFLPAPLGGVYLVQAKGAENWRNDTALVTISDLALTGQRSGDDLAVWVTSLSSGKLVPGAEVSVVSRRNQKLAARVVDASGLVRFKAGELDREGGPWFLTARSGEDWNFLELDRQAWQFEETGVSGRERSGPLDAFLLTDRGVYRPGEPLHFSGLVRTGQGGLAPDLPLEVVMRRPDSRVWQRLTVTSKAGQQGFFTGELTTDSDCPTGVYSVTVGVPGGQRPLASLEVPITPFEPARMEVKTKAVNDPAAAPVAAVQADYLFGSPAAACAVAWTGRVRPQNFVSATFPGFTFGRTDEASARRWEKVSAKLDEKGHASFALAEALPKITPGSYEAAISATVSETGGRSVTSSLRASWPAFQALPGVRLPGAPRAGVSFAAEVVQVTPAGTPAASGEVSWKLSRQLEHWTLQKSGDGYVWRFTSERLPVSNGVLPASVETIRTLALKAESSGSHLLELVAADGSRTELPVEVGNEQGESVVAAVPHRLGLTLLSGPARPGASARIRLETPFAGEGWVTLQGGGISWERVVSVPRGGLDLEVPIPADLRGNGWITATVVRAVDPASEVWKPVRAHGLLEVPLDHLAEKSAPTLEAAGDVRPGCWLDLTVRGPAGSWVQVWAVDEGVLLTTDYQTPDPWAHFYGRSRHDGNSRDTYAGLLPDHRRAMERIGAGGEGGARMRVGAVRTQRPSVVVRWLDPMPLNSNGLAQFAWKVPEDYTGRLRLMAVAASGPRVGSARLDVTVASPLMLEAAWPRFAAPGDEVRVPVKVFNHSEKPVELADWELTAEGPVAVVERPSAGVVAPGATAQRWLVLRMGEVLGEVSLRLALASGGETAEVSGLFTVRPALPRETRVTTRRIKAGERIEVAAPADFFSGTVETLLAVGTQPDVDLRPAVQRLLDYPYGCLEQTTSRLLVLLEAGSVLGPEMGTVAKPMISVGLARLALFQTSSGGLAYWPGDHEANAWGTCYAAEALRRAQEDGLPVPAGVMENLPAYLRRLMTNRDTPASLQAHAAWLLARMDQPETARMNLLSADPGQLDMAGRGHLALAWLASGRRDRAMELLTPDTLALTDGFSGTQRLHSALRGRAVLLRALLEADPAHPAIPGLAKAIDQQRDRGYWGTTLDNAAAVGSLAAWHRTFPAAAANLKVRCSAPGVTLLGQAGDFRLRGKGAFAVETSGDGPAYVTQITHGLLRELPKAFADNNLRVRRRWLDQAGKELLAEGTADVKVKVGDLVRVEITVQTGDEAVANLAVCDLLPAGLEVESPSLKTSAPTAVNDSESNNRPDRVEFRDDRVLCFEGGTRAARTHTYFLRATLPGRYVIPPLRAEAMYQPEISSGQAGGILVVEQP